MNNITIVGAGLAGLLAAHAWPKAGVVEAQPGPRAMHHALLRFRTENVSRLTGIEFRRVRVHKGVWSEQRLHTVPTIRLANMYAQKVVGRLSGDRSIWALDPVDRFVAPETLYEQLVETVGNRIQWDTRSLLLGGTFVSTAPLAVTAETVGLPAPACERAPITVVRCRVPGADVFQTVYFPDEDTPMYRASITGSLLIIEAMSTPVQTKEWLPRALVLVERAFALRGLQVIDTVNQSYGKIAPIPEPQRKALLFKLTHEHGIYSLGRFATWRNCLLDDVVEDIAAIKRLMLTGSGAYDASKSMR